MNSRTLLVNRGEDIAWLSRHALEDARLTWKAKGLLLYLVNMVPGTTVNWTEMEGHSADGKDAIKAARKELAALGYLRETAAGIHVTDGIAGNPLTATPVQAKAAREIRKPVASPGGGKSANQPTRNADIPQPTSAETCAVESSISNSVMSISKGDIHRAHVHAHAQGSPGNLFGLPDGDKATTMRKSLLNWKVCKTMFADMIALNVDVEYYFNSILEWSDKKHRQYRTSEGWASTIRGAMRRDKDAGKLRMVGGSKNELSSADALNYLNL